MAVIALKARVAMGIGAGSVHRLASHFPLFLVPEKFGKFD